MKIIPAIDLMKGECVRLTRGRAESRKVYFKDPLEPLRKFESAGVEWVHVVDLDAAMGLGDNTETIKEMLNRASVKLEAAGGIRTIEKAKNLLQSGASRIVLGTAVAMNPGSLDYWVEELGGVSIGVALDFKGEGLMVEGWKAESRIDHLELLSKINDLKIGAAILTCIEKDGTLKGPDLKRVEEFKRLVKVPLIASGGVSSITDLEKLNHMSIKGVIVGKAIYEGVLDLEAAIKHFRDR